MRREESRRALSLRLQLLFTAPLLMLGAVATAQDDTEWEYEPGEGYHEEEWHDPGDWFNEDDQVSYEGDWYDYDYDLYDDSGYNDSGYGYDLYDDHGWDDSYGYDADSDDYGWSTDESDPYGWHYEWNPATNQWETDYGYETGTYPAGAGDSPAYGWYYTWNQEEDRWEREYGWHDSQYQTGGEQGQQQRTTGRRDQRQQQSQGQRSDERYAQQGQRGQQERRSAMQGQQQRGQDSQQGQRYAQTVTGEIESFNHVRLKNAEGGHILVRLRTQDGSIRIVDLGPRVRLDQLGLFSGDRVTVKGREGWFSDRDVLMARAIRHDGQSMQVPPTGDTSSSRAREAGFRRQGEQQQRPMRQQDSMGQQAQRRSEQRSTMEFSGRIEDFQEVSVKGAPDDHLLLRLRMQDGSTRIVDMGPSIALSELDLQTGERIVVRGQEKSDGARKVLCADRVRVGGQQVDLDWQKEGEKQGSGDMQSGQQPRGSSTLFGQLDGYQRMYIGEDREEHLYVRLRLEDGSARVVDLGADAELSQMNLEQGDWIRVTGEQRQVDGRSVLVADQMRIDGRAVESVGGGSRTKGR